MAADVISIGALRERTTGEHRVSVTPHSVYRLKEHGVRVLVESGAGAASWISDEDFEAAGAEVVSIDRILETADLLTCVRSPTEEVLATMHPGQFLLGMLQSGTDGHLLDVLSSNSIVGIDLSLLPRTMSSAQSMDAMTSQDSVAGYKAVIVSAGIYERYFPMMITAAGTSRPAKLLVLGAGIAGLQAMGTARRLGADVSGYDIRPECRSEIESLGAKFLEVDSDVSSIGTDGYARALSNDEQASQQGDMNSAVAEFDVVITTARVPGHRPPVLVTADALKAMRPGSVVVDMAASDLGGNVDGSAAGRTILTPNGVTVIGAPNLASTVASSASFAFARNVSDVIAHFIRGRRFQIDTGDPIDAAIVVGSPPVPATSAPVQPLAEVAP